MYFSVDKFYY